MTVDEYKLKVIELFQTGRATAVQWAEMATAVLHNSEMYSSVDAIDAAVYPEEQSAEGETKP